MGRCAAKYLSPVRKLSSQPFVYEGQRKSIVDDRFDWRDKKVIGKIRNQQKLYSMWPVLCFFLFIVSMVTSVAAAGDSTESTSCDSYILYL